MVGTCKKKVGTEDEIMNSKGEFTFSEDFRTVSFTFKEDITETKNYFLIIAGFSEFSGTEKLLDISVKEICPDDESLIYTSESIDVNGCNLVKAFLWDGISPVVHLERKNI